MLQIKPEFNRFQFASSWTLAIVLGWMLIVYPGLNLRNEIIGSWNIIPELAWKLFTGALALGLAVGIFQYGILYFTSKVSGWWVLLSAVSYAVSTPLAFVMAVFWLSSVNPETMTSHGQSFISMPLAFIMLFAGVIIGLMQLPGFKVFLSSHRWAKILLWVLGTSLSWGLGFFATTYTWGPNIPLFVQSGSAGLVIGVITGLLVLVMVKD